LLESTSAQERLSNLALTVDDEDTFVARLVAGLTAYPATTPNGGFNSHGPAPVDLSPPEPVGDGGDSTAHPRW